MTDVVVISQHERGFWQADLYRDASEWTDEHWLSGVVPDNWCSAGSREDLQTAISAYWPYAEVRFADEEY